jgi:chromate transporter
MIAAISKPAPKWVEVALLFLRLGFTAFGGPAAHIAIMEDEVVRRRRWMPAERFLDLLGIANLIPGPSSTELAIFIGYEEAGWVGLILAGVCFILPAALIVALMAWAYVRFGGLPQVGGALYGIKPVVIAVIVQALVRLVPKALKKSPGLASLCAAGCAASAAGVAPLEVLLGAGALSAIVAVAGGRGASGDAGRAVVPLVAGPVAGVAAATPASLLALFLAFLKVGALVFGSGYVLLAFLRADLVEHLHWLTEGELVDAVAVGQVTPGPVFTTATFIGYLVGRGWGALVATIGIFLPSFVLVAAARPQLSRLRSSAVTGAFLDGVNAASLALMAVVAVELARATLLDVPAAIVAVVAAALLLATKTSPTWIVLGGAALGLARQFALSR